MRPPRLLKAVLVALVLSHADAMKLGALLSTPNERRVWRSIRMLAASRRELLLGRLDREDRRRVGKRRLGLSHLLAARGAVVVQREREVGRGARHELQRRRVLRGE